MLFAKRGKKLHIKGQPQLLGTLRQRVSQNSFVKSQSQNTKLLQVDLKIVAHLCNWQFVQLSSRIALCLQDYLNPLIFWSGFAQQIQKKIDSQQLDIQITFWEWFRQHPEISIILCEGEKKAACLLSLGFVAIALAGIWNGRVGKQDFDERLHPDLVPMAQAGRKFIILFDYETKANTRWSVFQAIVRTLRTIESQSCTGEVALLPGPEKGVDDFVVGRGENADALLSAIVNDAKSLFDYQRSYRAKKWGLSKYLPDVTVNIKYLTQALCLTDLSKKCSSAPALYNMALEKLFSPNLIPTDCDLDKGKKEREELIDSDSFNAKPSTQNPKKSFHFPHKRLVVLWSDMGTGKTQLMRWWRDQNPDARFLNNGHRVNLIKNLAERLDTAHYSAVAKANITTREYRQRQSKDYLTPQEVFENEKFRIFDSYGIDVTPELVELDNGGRLIRAIAFTIGCKFCRSRCPPF